MSAFDEALHAYLADRKAEQFDAFMSVVGVAVEAARPALRRRAASLGTGLEIDDVIGQVVERAVEHLVEQWHGRAAFAFRREYGLSFEGWLLQILGRPGTGRRSGMIGEMIQSRRRKTALVVPMELDDLAVAADEPDDREEAIERAVVGLTPRDQFVIRAAFGLHPFVDLDAAAIARLARLVGFDAATVRKIARRAKTIARDGTEPATSLARADIAHLLDVGERQVGNIRTASLAQLMAAYSALAEEQSPA